MLLGSREKRDDQLYTECNIISVTNFCIHCLTAFDGNSSVHAAVVCKIPDHVYNAESHAERDLVTYQERSAHPHVDLCYVPVCAQDVQMSCLTSTPAQTDPNYRTWMSDMMIIVLDIGTIHNLMSG